MTNPEIRWDLLAEAKAFYESKGYVYTEMSWNVSGEIYEATKPCNEDKEDLYVPQWDRFLIASGEQALLESRFKHQNKQLQTITPCFRSEQEYNSLRRPHFMKLELMLILDQDLSYKKQTFLLEQVIDDAYAYFSKYSSLNKIVKFDDNTWDINCNNVEVGSYGIREYQDFRWIYGTGLAEPRFSQAIQLE